MIQYLDRYVLYRRMLFTVFWVWATFGFLQEEMLPFLASIRSTVFMGLDIVMLFLAFVCVRDKQSILFSLLFLVLAFISTVISQGLSIVNLVNGCRDFLPLLSLPMFRELQRRYGADFIERFDKQLYYFLILQAPCVVWQFLNYGANDAGGGSLGYGYSGVISTLIYIISFYLIQKRWTYTNYFRDLLDNKLLIFLLFPTFLNETKVSFVFCLCYFILLMKIDAKIMFKMVVAAPLVLIVLFLVYNVYLSATGNEDDITSLDYYTDTYLAVDDPDHLMLLGEMLQDGEFEDDDWVVDLPRFTKLMFFPILMESSENSKFIGAGVSHFKGGTSLKLTKFATDYQWALLGSVPYIYFVLVQLGYVGLVGFIGFILVTGFEIGRYRPNRMLNLQFFLIIVMVILLCYNDSFRVGIFSSIFCYILFRSNSMSLNGGKSN
ncbi:MAG: hypothetical protein IKV32_05680 [Muribaculaceae bacterium]|nr:hypothetical protein [Muribaculaceae bacterium]